MCSSKDISIVGGGLAGLTLGIALRQRRVSVTVHEAGVYPRHRVCGEFMSGAGVTYLQELGMLDALVEAGAIPIRTFALFYHGTGTGVREVPPGAWALSRYELDHLLALEFQRRGGHLHENKRWRGSFPDGTVRATGRHPERRAGSRRFIGLKVHARHVSLAADLEIHFVPGGYVGLCRLPRDETNVCGLFRRQTQIPDLHRNWRNLLSGAERSFLRERMSEAVFDPASFCAVAGLPADRKSLIPSEDLTVGDAMGMTPPLTGNGMSMAFESAHLAVGPLCEYAAGDRTWIEVTQSVHLRHLTEFARRIHFAGTLEQFLFRSSWQWTATKLAQALPGAIPWFFTATR